MWARVRECVGEDSECGRGLWAKMCEYGRGCVSVSEGE